VSGLLASLPALWLLAGGAYPVDGYEESGIRRVERLRLRLDGKLTGPVPPPGARKPSRDIRLWLGEADRAPEALPAADPVLQRDLAAVFAGRDETYSIALLDVTPGRPLRFASLRASSVYQPGSVAKLAVAAGLFTELKTLFPDSTEARRRLLRERQVVADEWIRTDHHTVPFFDPAQKAMASRPIRDGDVFSLYEWADHMLSASSNAAASTVWKELILMRAFGAAYPPSREVELRYFKETPVKQVQEIAHAVVDEPLRRLGITEEDFKLGQFFTATPNRRFPPTSGSGATPLGALLYLVRLEEGRIVDAWSSLELKKLLYMTERRIRYASSPRLAGAAVYFKSGSLFECRPEPGFVCKQYQGNQKNYMNSVAIVERPDGAVYLVALMSNVLKINSAVEHQSLATFIDGIVGAPAPVPSPESLSKAESAEERRGGRGEE
jgi:hypothetical protein